MAQERTKKDYLFLTMMPYSLSNDISSNLSVGMNWMGDEEKDKNIVCGKNRKDTYIKKGKTDKTIKDHRWVATHLSRGAEPSVAACGRGGGSSPPPEWRTHLPPGAVPGSALPRRAAAPHAAPPRRWPALGHQAAARYVVAWGEWLLYFLIIQTIFFKTTSFLQRAIRWNGLLINIFSILLLGFTKYSLLNHRCSS